MSDMLMHDEESAVAKLNGWVAPHSVRAKRQDAYSDVLLVKIVIRERDKEHVSSPVVFKLPVREDELRMHANSLREFAGLKDLPHEDAGHGFFGRPKEPQR